MHSYRYSRREKGDSNLPDGVGHCHYRRADLELPHVQTPIPSSGPSITENGRKILFSSKFAFPILTPATAGP